MLQKENNSATMAICWDQVHNSCLSPVAKMIISEKVNDLEQVKRVQRPAFNGNLVYRIFSERKHDLETT